MILLDTSIFLALVQPHQRSHREILAWYGRRDDSFVTTPFVAAELDYLLRAHGTQARIEAFYANLETGAIHVEWWPEALITTLAVARRRPDVGLTDASLVALGAHHETNEIATLDERHFRTLKPLTGHPRFKLLPADAD